MNNTANGFPVTESPTEDIIENMETCALCGSRLRFKHQMDYLNLKVQEEACCPECGIKNIPVDFVLQ